MNCLNIPAQSAHNWLAAEMSPFRIQVFWREDYFRCWNSIVFSVAQEPESSFLRLKQAVSLLARSSLEDFSLVSENKEPQMAAGAGVGSTGAAFTINLVLGCIVSDSCCHFHALGIFPLLLVPTFHVPSEADFQAASQALGGFGNYYSFAVP